MKFCRAWPESCQTQEQPETQILASAEVYPKDLVETEVRQRLQAQINRVIDDVVHHDQTEEDPKPPKAVPKLEVRKRKSRKSHKLAKNNATAVPETRDLWIAIGAISILFLILLSSLYSKIAVLEKVIFESRV